jgi:hypothetical protein
VARPPRSPDLTPMDFFLWDYIKILICTSPVDSEVDLFTRIVEAAANVRQRPFILNAYVSLCCVGVGCLSRSVAVLLNMCSKLLRNTTFFFQKTSVMLLDFQPLSDPL